MDQLPTLNGLSRVPLTLPDQCWLADHHFMGRPVLPAVLALQLIRHHLEPDPAHINTRHMHAAVFDKFLYLPHSARGGRAPDGAGTPLELEIYRTRKDYLEAGLYSRSRLPGGMIRRKRHARVCFGTPAGSFDAAGADGPIPSEADPQKPFTVAPQRVYQELVPLGPSFQNITGPVQLFADRARARVSGGKQMGTGTAAAAPESPFVLDAAMHVACVWSQRYAGCVAFPVGFELRRIRRPCLFEAHYDAVIHYRSQTNRELLFDIHILDDTGRIYEHVAGLRMRDLSGGRWKPPSWLSFGH